MSPLRWALRVLVMLPPLALLYAGVSQLLLAPYDWRGEHIGSFEVSYWAISAQAIILALPATLAGVGGTWSVWRLTRGEFRLGWIVMAGALVMIAGAALVGLLLAGNAETAFNSSWFGESNYGAIAVAVFTSTLFLGGAAVGGMYIYCGAIDSNTGARFEKRPDEPDATGAIIESMGHHGTT